MNAKLAEPRAVPRAPARRRCRCAGQHRRWISSAACTWPARVVRLWDLGCPRGGHQEKSGHRPARRRPRWNL